MQRNFNLNHMVLISNNPKVVKELDAYPRWVKESAMALCFFTKAEISAIQITVDQNDTEGFKKAIDDFAKTKRENPDKVIIMIGLKPSTIIDYYSPTHQFPRLHRSQAFAQHALTKLKGLSLVEANLQEDTWLYIFGYATPQSQPMKIKWLGTKENLRQFLTLWYEEELRHKEITHKEIRSYVPLCFVDKNGKPKYLSKARKEDSQVSDDIEKIFRPQ